MRKVTIEPGQFYGPEMERGMQRLADELFASIKQGHLLVSAVDVAVYKSRDAGNREELRADLRRFQKLVTEAQEELTTLYGDFAGMVFRHGNGG